jgi:hypothetical protein
MVGAVAGFPGLSNAFLAKARPVPARPRGLGMPGDEPTNIMLLLHLDARPDLVQCIKLCEYIMGEAPIARARRASLNVTEKPK